FPNEAFKMDTFPRKLPGHAFEVLDEGFLAITHAGIVLDIGISDIAFDGLARLTLVKHQVIECYNRFLVPLQSVHRLLLLKMPNAADHLPPPKRILSDSFHAASGRRSSGTRS